jgi:hypothetical protein
VSRRLKAGAMKVRDRVIVALIALAALLAIGRTL